MTEIESSEDDRLPVGLLIGGEWSGAGGSAQTFTHVNPANGVHQREVPVADASDVDSAVASAGDALRTWKRLAPEQRAAALNRLADLLDLEAESFRVIAALERGAPVGSNPTGWVAKPGTPFNYAASWCDKVMGSTIPVPVGSALDYTLVEPVGVVAVLPTWNGPMWSISVAAAPALACGCTVVIKSPELAPFSSVRFAQLCVEAGFPDGVVNVVSGGPETGGALVRNGGVDKIHFTGGLETARRIRSEAADQITPMVLELGGKSASIVFPDADLDKASTSVASWIPLNAGQSCTGASRLIVHESVHDELVERLVTKLEAYTVGDPFDPATNMGPLISEGACQRIASTVEAAAARGSGTIVTGGKRLGGVLSNGCFYPPTVLVGVDNSDKIAQDEIFGPVITVTTFSDEREAVAIANDSRYGLAAYVHTSDLSRALRLVYEIDAGNIGVNGPGTTAPAGLLAPFGGFKDSGFGKENGPWGIQEFLNTKNVMIVL